MKKLNNLPVPPWDMDSAAARLQLLENDFNLLDAEKISTNYTNDAEVRIGTLFLHGQKEIENYYAGDLSVKKAYKLTLDLWGALKGRMAVRYEIEWKDVTDKAFKTYGVQVLQFNEDGLIEMNYASFNDNPLS